jgi:hypothetical protein
VTGDLGEVSPVLREKRGTQGVTWKTMLELADPGDAARPSRTALVTTLSRALSCDTTEVMRELLSDAARSPFLDVVVARLGSEHRSEPEHQAARAILFVVPKRALLVFATIDVSDEGQCLDRRAAGGIRVRLGGFSSRVMAIVQRQWESCVIPPNSRSRPNRMTVKEDL